MTNLTNVTNILLIEDNPADARAMLEMLKEARGDSIAVLRADRLAGGLRQISEGGVDLVLLDLSLPDSRGFDTFTKLHAAAKELPVIVLTGLDDEELALRAVREGAQDYMVKGSVSAKALARSIRFAVERHKTAIDAGAQRKSARGRVLCFVGAKGGVGTTTVVLNTAALLAKQGKSVIALEMRSFGSSFSIQTKQTPNRNLGRALDLGPEPITEAQIEGCLVSLPFGIKAAFASRQAADFREIQPEQVKAILSTASRMADYVIVDLPSEPCQVTQAAVNNCDGTAMVVVREPACLKAGKSTTELLALWGVAEKSLLAVVVVKDAEGFISPEELASRLGCAIAGVIPPAAELCAASLKAGTPLCVLDPESIAAGNFTRLVERLAGSAVLVHAL
jgi:MinD-like ATPase involved in chromosome partitioning or flagellar assembly/CheY-like chemotaxis protein